MKKPVKPPIPGKFYEHRGYIFRVDLVHDGEVYLCRWPKDGADGSLMRTSILTWEREMADAKEIKQ